MSKQEVTKGATSQIVYVFIRDSSATTGVGLTGLAYNTASLVASYVRPAAARSAITLATQTTTGAFSSGGFVEVDATNMPGVYRLDVPDAVFATGVNSAVVMLKGATNMEPCLLEFELKAMDFQDAVRAGLTALPNAAAEAAGGLYTRGTGAGQINQPANGMADVNLMRWLGTAASTPTVAGVPNVNVKTWNDLAAVALPLAPTTAGRTLDVSATGEAGIDWANVGSPTTAVNLSATNIDVDQVVASVSGAVGSVTGAVGSVTGNVGGNVTGSVGTVNALAANVITATAINADAFTAAKFAADVTTEFQSGLATAAALDAVDNFLDTEIADIQARLPAALVSGRIDASVGAMAADVMTAAAAAADLTTELQSGLATAAALSTMQGNVTDILADTAAIDARLPSDPADESLVIAATDAVMARLGAPAGASVSADVAAVKVDTADIRVTTDKLDNTLENTSDGYIFTVNGLQNAPAGSGPTAAAIADAVWEEAIADHSGTSGSTAEALSAAGSAGDPWITALPGSYSAGQAGYIIGTNLDAQVSAVPTNAELATALGTADDAILAVLGTPAGASMAADILAVQADTNDLQTRLPAALVSGRIDASVGAMAANVLTAAATAADFTNEVTAALATSAALTSVAGDITAVKAKTDNLPTDPADESLIIAATDAIMTRVGAPVGASISADIAAVAAKTTNLPSDPADASVVAGLIAAVEAKVDIVDTNVDAILLDTGTDGVVVATASKTGYQLSATGVDDILDEVVDGATTLRQSVRLSNSALGGKASGLGTTEVTFRDLADTKDRLVATVDGVDGNRTAVTRDLT